MNRARVRRYGRRRPDYRRLWGCGCFIVFAFAMLVIYGWLFRYGALVSVMLELAGADSLGSTDGIFAELSPVPTAVLFDRIPQLGEITVLLGSFGDETVIINEDVTAYTGNTVAVMGMAQVSFTEPSLMNVCRQRSEICNKGHELYRNVNIDLRPGGAVIYVDVGVRGYWQRIGVVVQLDSTHTRLFVVGVDVKGVVYDPETLPFGLSGIASEAISQIERQGNMLLRDLSIELSGSWYTVSEITIDETALTLTLH